MVKIVITFISSSKSKQKDNWNELINNKYHNL